MKKGTSNPVPKTGSFTSVHNGESHYSVAQNRLSTLPCPPPGEGRVREQRLINSKPLFERT